MKAGFREFCKHIDIVNSQKIIDILSNFGDDKATGNRSAGSKASTEAANYLYREFERIGLKNLTRDKFCNWGWTYKGANISYKDENGQEQKIVLGGYATSIEAEDDFFKVVDGGSGTISDYKSLGDVTNKLVLISIDPFNDFWVSYPAYQAYLKGAKAVLVVTKYKVQHEDYLISQPVEGPSYAHVLAISKRDSDILKNLINKAADKEITVKLNAHSYVEPEKASYNIWGEIPGKTDEVIYLMAHYDGYYHSYFDDASGVSTILGIAKAIIDSGYKPNKTIRVITHGAEEWGRENSDYDWAMGAYEEITHIHPEWAKKAFAVINIDGNFPVPNERNFQIMVSDELLKYTKKSVRPILHHRDYKFKFISPTSTGSEEFCYTKTGIPCITARDSMTSSIYYTNIYHSSMDNKAFGFDTKTYKLNHILYGKILLDLDAVPIRPMDFYERFFKMRETINSNIVEKSLVKTIKKASNYAQELSSKIEKLNLKNASMTGEKANYINLNLKLFELYKMMQNSFIRLNWEVNVVFPHENYGKNVDLLKKAIKALKNRRESLEEVVNKYIKPIDFNKYVYDFDRRTYKFFSRRVTHENNDTWGYNLVEKPNEDLYEVAQSLRNKFNEKNPDVDAEMMVLRKALKRQAMYLKEIVFKEKTDIEKIIVKMKKISSII